MTMRDNGRDLNVCWASNKTDFIAFCQVVLATLWAVSASLFHLFFVALVQQICPSHTVIEKRYSVWLLLDDFEEEAKISLTHVTEMSLRNTSASNRGWLSFHSILRQNSWQSYCEYKTYKYIFLLYSLTYENMCRNVNSNIAFMFPYLHLNVWFWTLQRCSKGI